MSDGCIEVCKQKSCIRLGVTGEKGTEIVESVRNPRSRYRSMAIIGSTSRVSRGSTMSGSSTDDNPPLKPRPKAARGDVGDSEGSEDETPERGSEVCQIGDDMCNVPSQLFDLSNLKGILSLNTWNYCLTEEERESLFAFLPPIEDEETFKDTIRELLGGANFHFSSPMDDLFERIKGGLCHPRVLRYREGLKYLERKEHYHLMRQYHNHMVSLFVEMQKKWERCPNADLNERLEIWEQYRAQPPPLHKSKPMVRKSRTLKRVKGVPEGSTKKVPDVISKTETLELLKKGKSPHKSRKEMGALASPLKKRAGVLIRTIGSMGVLKKTHLKESLEGASRRLADLDKVDRGDEIGKVQDCKPGPKGVLKLVSKGKGVLRKTSSLAVKGKEPIMEIKREVVEIMGDEEEDEPLTPVEEGAVAPAPVPPVKIVIGEGSSEKTCRRKVPGEGRKRKTFEFGNEEPEGEKVARKKKKKIKEPKKQELLTELSELLLKEVPPHEDINTLVNKGKKVADLKKKPHRKKKIEEIPREPVEMLVEVNKAVEDAGRPSDDMYELPGEVVAEDDQPVDAKPPTKKSAKKKPKVEKVSVPSPAQSSPHAGSPGEKAPGSFTKVAKKPMPLAIPTLASTFPFSIMHLLSAVRAALIFNYGEGPSTYHDPLEKAESSRERFDLGLPFAVSEGNILGQGNQSPRSMERGDVRDGEFEPRPHALCSVPFAEVVRRVHVNPGDPCILETQEPLQDLVRGALKIMGSKVAPAGAKGWKPLVSFDKELKAWSWTGSALAPVASTSSQDMAEVQITSEAWGIPQKTLLKMEDMFANWLKHDQETLQQIVQLPLPPPPPMPTPVDEKERFRDLRAQKSLMTITPSSEGMRSYFRREELLRYSLPDRAFSYTTADGRKSVVAPLRRGGGKPTSKARDHFMLKPDRPPHVTILCLVRDAAARLPGSIGTRADVCALIRDSQFIVEDVSDAQVNQVVSGALDRLHYERDPCVRFDGDRKLWVYLHTEREEEDFEDDGTSSTKRWKKPKKESAENLEQGATAYETGSPSGADNDPTGTGLIDMHSPDGMGGPVDHSAIYSVGRTELVYNKSSSLTSPRVLGNSTSRDDGGLPFIELPPNIDSGHPMGWEGVTSQASWDQDSHLHSQESLGTEDDYDMEAAAAAQRDADAMINADTE